MRPEVVRCRRGIANSGFSAKASSRPEASVADDHYRVRSRGVGLLLQARSVGVIRRFLPLPRDRRRRRAKQIAEQVKRLRCVLLFWLRSIRIPPISPSAPELSVGWQVRDETEAEGRRNCGPDRSSKSSPFVCLHPWHKGSGSPSPPSRPRTRAACLHDPRCSLLPAFNQPSLSS
jgi:hypothetical protein